MQGPQLVSLKESPEPRCQNSNESAGAPRAHGPAGNPPFDGGETVFRGKTRTGSPGERRQRRGQRRALRRRAEAKAEAEEEEEEEDGTKLKKQSLQHG